METLLINGSEIRSLLTIEECIAGVEEAFRLRALGKAEAPHVLGVHLPEGGFHIKSGTLRLGRHYFVSKTNANFPNNRTRHSLPTIQGVTIVSDADDGRLLALMDSIAITVIRTGAATAVAAKYLSQPESRTLTICGCGMQGRISVHALRAVRDIHKVFLFDIDRRAADRLAAELRDKSIDVEIATDLKHALAETDICVTCTTSKAYFIKSEDVKPGMFIAAVGADNEDKQELEPQLLAESIVVVDSLEQASKIGELHHALALSLVDKESVVELGDVISGLKPFKNPDHKVTIFDSTGTALQDVAAAAIVYEKAVGTNSARFSFP